MEPNMDKLQTTGQNLGRVFNFRSGCVRAMHLLCNGLKLLNLELKTRPKTNFRLSPVWFRAPRT